MHKKPSLAFMLLILLGALSCVGDAPVSDDIPEQPGGDGGSSGTDDPSPGGNRDGCPTYEPKIGESCPASFGDGARCSFLLGSCLVGGAEHDLAQDYCCFAGLWNQCPAEDPGPPCDQLDAGAPDTAAPDDGGVADDAADAGDAADDALDGGVAEPGATDAGPGDDAADDLASD
jgi:hypothetical protein